MSRDTIILAMAKVVHGVAVVVGLALPLEVFAHEWHGLPVQRTQKTTALLEIEHSLLEFAVSIMRSVHAIEVSVVRDRIFRSVS